MDIHTHTHILQEEIAEGSETVGIKCTLENCVLFIEIEEKQKKRSGPLREKVSKIYGFT